MAKAVSGPGLLRRVSRKEVRQAGVCGLIFIICSRPCKCQGLVFAGTNRFLNLSQNTPLWFDKLTTSGGNPLTMSLSKDE
jgi:hypothetical protein